VFVVALAVVFAVWCARERTLAIHSNVTTARESFYWLTVLVTFTLGTAAGDWTLDLTGAEVDLGEERHPDRGAVGGAVIGMVVVGPDAVAVGADGVVAAHVWAGQV
jgi:uncharacterized membrane-anchored protein